MSRLLTWPRSLIVSAAVLMAGCASTPCVTSSAPGGLIDIRLHEQVRTSFVIGHFERLATKQFWLFAEDNIDFHFYSQTGPEPSQLTSDYWILLPSPDIRVIAYVNGLPVGFHCGRLLVGTHDFGPIAEGDTVEFTASGIVVEGQQRGAIPQS
jgi:hypothetical protein